jgi:hypothetical protein
MPAFISWRSLYAVLIYTVLSLLIIEHGRSLNLSFVPCAPLLLIMCLDRLGGRLTRLGFAWRAAALLIAQFMICQKVAATCFMFGAIAGLLAFVCLPAWRAALRRTVTLVAVPPHG